MRRLRLIVPFVMVVLGATFAACSSVDEPKPDAHGTIGPSGGSVSAGPITLDIPAGALDAEQTISIRETTDAPPADTDALSKVYTFEPAGLVFKAPVRVRFATTEDPTDGEVFWTDEGTTSLEPLETTVEPGSVVASTTHFSRGCAVKHRCRPQAACALGPTCTRTLTKCKPGRDQEITRECTCSSGRYQCSNAQRTCAATDAGADAGDADRTEPCIANPPSTAVVRADGRCLVTFAPLYSPYAFVLDATHVYFTRANLGGRSIAKVPRAGGPVVELATTPTDPFGIAVDGTHFYWTEANPTTSTISRAPLAGVPDGGSATELASALAHPLGIVLRGSNLYWANYAQGASGGGIQTMPVTGGTPTDIATGQDSPTDVVLDATHAYWVNGGPDGPVVVGSVRKAPLAGGTPVELAATGEVSGYLAVDATHVYWAVSAPNTTNGTVWKVPKTGGVAVQIASGQAHPNGIAVDDDFVYWANYGTGAGAILKAPKNGGAVTVLASAQNHPLQVTLDGTSIYWNEYDKTGGSLRKLTPR